VLRTAEDSAQSRFDASAAIGMLLIASGSFVLLGWFLHLPVLIRVFAGYATVKPFTAISFILAGTALHLLRMPPVLVERHLRAYFWGRILAFAVLFLSLEPLGETLFHIDSGFNQILFHQTLLSTGLEHPGRMSTATALGFVLLSLSLLLINVESRRGSRPSDYLALFSSIMGLLGVAGYIYQGKELYSSTPFHTMAIPTAVLLVMSGIGVLGLRPQRGFISIILSHRAGGWMARRILPITSVLPFAIGWLRTHGERAGLYNRDMGFVFFATGNIVILSMIVWTNARSLNRIDAERDETEKDIQLAAEEARRMNRELRAEALQRQEAQELLRLTNVHLEAKVAERTANLLAANKELEAFSYSVSHDLRAPLRSIDGFTMLLLQGADALGTEEKRFLDRISFNSQKMGRLIDDLLNFSRLSRSSLRHTEVDLSALAFQIFDELRKAHPNRQVETIIEPGMKVSGDENLLRIVLDNLLGNAWKFTGKKESAQIEFASRPEEGQRVFFVRDNGAGFDMTYAERLFGAFQRLHGTDEFEGNGIGLATVQRILARHHGTIRAEAKRGEGATFSFILPPPEEIG